MTRLFRAAKLILPDGIFSGWLLIEDDRIAAVCTDGCPEPQADEVIDLAGQYLSPGFVDTHVHGGGGYDVMDGTTQAVCQIAKLHARYGMTSFCPTTLTAEMPAILQARDAALAVRRQQQQQGLNGQARVLGVHLEGPCFSNRFRGAQNPAYLMEPRNLDLDQLLGAPGDVLRVSAAPELPGAYEMAQQLRQRKIAVSIAHSDADYAVVKKAAEHGFHHATHLFNGMSGLQSPDYYCRAGVIESVLLMDSYSAEVIADGRHMPAEMLQLMYKCKGPANMQLCTDAMRATGMPEGEYELGGLAVLVEDGVAMLADRTSFAGSVATSDRLVRTAHFVAGFPLHEAVAMASLHPAQLVGWDDRIGSLQAGKLADLVVLNDQLMVQAVYLAGQPWAE